MPAKKILFVYNTAEYLLRFRAPLIGALKQQGFEVHALTPIDVAVAGLVKLGVVHHPWRISQHGLNPLAELMALRQAYRVLGELRPNIVISYTIKCNIYMGLLSRIRSFHFLPNIVGLGRAFQGNGVGSRSAFLLYRAALSRATRVFFQNTEDRDLFISGGALSPAQAVVTPGSGVNLDHFAPEPDSSATAKRIFLMYGRLIPEKGFAAFLAVARRFKQEHPGRAEFWIAGGIDGTQPASLKLREEIERAQAEGVVVFHGFQSDVRNLLRHASVVVLPSTYNEGVPRSLLEALSMAKPIITTDWKGCRETILDGVNGIKVPPHDGAALYDAHSYLLSLGARELSHMGSASRALAEKKFSEVTVLKMYLDVIETLECDRRIS